ncbi:MAG: hypothetical protein MJY47_05760 [Fibrobacter sp.]|nr:hypothetical protein [Fibrobacter sp.]
MKKTLFMAIAVSLCLWACGDENSDSWVLPDEDSSNSNSEGDSPEEASTYESEDDMPSCTNSRKGELALVGKDYFVCIPKKWKNIDEVVKSLCDVPSCDEDSEDATYYVSSEKRIYQCVDGSWEDSEGEGIDTKTLFNCLLEEVIQDTVETEEDLPSCSTKRNGKLIQVGDETFTCNESQWSPLNDVVLSTDELAECDDSREGDIVYIVEKKISYTCDGEVWSNGNDVIETKTTDKEDENGEESSSSGVASSSSTISPSSSSARVSSSSVASSSSKAQSSSSTKVSSSSVASSSSRAQSSSTTKISSSSVASSSSKALSSSSTKVSSSSTIASSSSTAGTGSSTSTSDIGTCAPVTTSSVPRGLSTKWVFTRSSGLPLTEYVNANYQWTFEGGSPSTGFYASNTTDDITYNIGGTFSATVSVNGRSPITCSPVTIEGADISCSCTPRNALVDINGSHTAAWDLSCSSIAEITDVTWNGATSVGSAYYAEKQVSAIGKVSGPTVSVSNEEGRTKSFTCGNVTAVDSTNNTFEITGEKMTLFEGTHSLRYGCNHVGGALAIYGNGTSSITWATDYGSGTFSVNYYSEIRTSTLFPTGDIYGEEIAVNISGGSVQISCY